MLFFHEVACMLPGEGCGVAVMMSQHREAQPQRVLESHPSKHGLRFLNGKDSAQLMLSHAWAEDVEDD